MTAIINVTLPALLSLPLEILELITVEVLKPTSVDELAAHPRYPRDKHQPRKHLIRRLSNISACKKLRNVALAGYFHLTQLTVTLGRVGWMFEEVAARQGIVLCQYSVHFGTFEDHDLFLANTVKLLIELKQEDLYEELLSAMSALIRKCPRLAHVTLRVGNLKQKEAEAFKTKIDETVKELSEITSRNIIARSESTKEYDADMKSKKDVKAPTRMEQIYAQFADNTEPVRIPMTLRTGNLSEDHAQTFKSKIDNTASEEAKAADHNILVHTEKNQQYKEEMEFREEVQHERNVETLRAMNHEYHKLYEENMLTHLEITSYRRAWQARHK